MTIEEELNGPKLTYLKGVHRVILTDDDRPPESEVEMEQQEDESHKDFRERKESEIRGERYPMFYLHDSGWLKCADRYRSDLEDKQWETVEYWYPPQRVETVR